MFKTIKGRRNAHNFKNHGGYSPTCDCGICDCFGSNTAIVYGYKQIVECVSYYCDKHKSEKSNDKYANEHFIRVENHDLKLKNKPIITTVDNVKPDKTIDKKKQMCSSYECKNTDNLVKSSYFYHNCVCENCAPTDKNIYFASGLNRSNDEFMCANCNETYKIKYELDESKGLYSYVGCNNPYKVIGTCNNMYETICQEFCTEIYSDGNIIRPIAIKPKRKNKSKNVEDPTIPENIITDEMFNTK